MKQLPALIITVGCWPGTAWTADNNAEKISDYTTMWKTMFAQSSGISEAVLAPLIKVDKTEIMSWNSGKTFVVQYTLAMDWARVTRRDKFMVWLSKSKSEFRDLGLPLDTWLSGQEIRKTIGNQALGVVIGKVAAKTKLAFTSLDEAKAFVCKANQLSSLDKADITFDVPGKIPHDDGQPYLVWSTFLDEKANKLMRGYINLVTKNGKSWQDVIRIVN